MILLQSYASPSPLSADYGVYKILKEDFDSLRSIYEQASTVAPVYIKKIMKLAWRANRESCSGETVLGWGGPLALYAWLFGKLSFRKRLYISQNLIFRGKTAGLKNKLMYNLYKRALHSKNFYMTVNAEGLVDYHAKMFDCDPRKFRVVYDNMELTDDQKQKMAAIQRSVNEPYVFFGGVAARDVETFVKIAEQLPEIKFRVVLKQQMILPKLRDLSNVELFHDIPKDEFYDILLNATVCCIPLNSNAPCGLYTMQHAILMNIPIVSTDTYSMRTIVPDDSCGSLFPIGDAQGMACSCSRTHGESGRTETDGSGRGKELLQVCAKNGWRISLQSNQRYRIAS